jgi:hypothetical protein
MSNTFYVARTDGLDVVTGGAHSDRSRTEDAAAVYERRAAAHERHGSRGRRWLRRAARPAC